MRCTPSAVLVGVVVLLGTLANADAVSAEARFRHSTPFPKAYRGHSLPHVRHAPVRHRHEHVVDGWRGHQGLGHGFCPQHGANRHGFPHHGHGFFPHHGVKDHHGHSFFPHHTWMWPYVSSDLATATIIQQMTPAAAQPAMPAVPSMTDLPVSLGVRSAPAASPTIYVLDGSQRSLRRGGSKVLSTDETKAESDAGDGGPRIIQLRVPRGR